MNIILHLEGFHLDPDTLIIFLQCLIDDLLSSRSIMKMALYNHDLVHKKVAVRVSGNFQRLSAGLFPLRKMHLFPLAITRF